MKTGDPRTTRLRRLYVGVLVFGFLFFVLGTLANRRTWPYLAIGLIVIVLLPGLAFSIPRSRLLSWRVSPKLTVLILSVLISGALCEIVLQLFYSQNFPRIPSDLGYVYDSVLGWLPVPNDRRTAGVGIPVRVMNNSLGLRGPEYPHTSKPGVLFVGDSFVWGLYVEVSDRFTERLQAKHPEWAIYNLGVTGYGTDQELLLLQRHFQLFKPRLVFLVFCVENDHDDNSLPIRYGCFKPYYTTNASKLRLNGVPAPWSEDLFCATHRLCSHSYLFRAAVRAYKKLTIPQPVRHDDPTTAIVAEMQQYLKEREVPFIVGLTAPDPAFEQFLKNSQIAHLDLSTSNRFSGDYHWSVAGHDFVSVKIEQFLLSEKYLSSIKPTIK